LLSAVALAATALGCSDARPDAVGEASSPVEGGHFINDHDDTISKMFPKSTVEVFQNYKSKTDWTGHCTGVILAENKVLTAAHCVGPTAVIGARNLVSGDTYRINFYPSGDGAGSVAIDAEYRTATQSGVALPDHVSCAPDGDGNVKDRNTCYNNGVLADMAVLTLSSKIGDKWKPAYLPVRGSTATLISQKRSPSTWIVGTGKMDYAKPYCSHFSSVSSAENPDGKMKWVPVASYVMGGAGKLVTSNVYADPGDSGGPMYRYAPNGDDLILVGIAHWMELTCTLFGNIKDHYNEEVDVSEGSNYDWLIKQGAHPVSELGSFGASE
jgi:hypothetical protein